MPKKRSLKPKQLRSRDVIDLFNESAAGIAISGDSGTGKSNIMLLLMEALCREVGITLIDPHGDLAQDYERSCSALPRRLRDRVLVVRPSDLSNVVAMNPLYVPDLGKGRLHWRAQVTTKVSHVGRVILYALGETNFNGKPVLLKWLTRGLGTCAEHRLTFPDCRHFFDVGSEIYDALARATPDLLARTEMADLAEMRPRDREELIGSTKNRVLNYLANPVVSLTLGRPDGWIDARQLVRERYITIVSLERGGVLREEDVEIFANLWLSEILFAIFNLPRHERTPHLICADELPVFASSHDLLTRAAGQIRKFQTRLLTGFQGTQLFPERTEDRLLNALIGQCGATIVLRHRNPVDAKFFGELVTLPVLDPLIEKHRLTQWQQYQDGHDVLFLTDENETWSDADQAGGSQSNAQSDTTTDTATNNRSSTTGDTVTRDERTLAEAVSRARSEQTGTSSSRATARGATATDGTSWSNTRTRGGGRTRKMTLVPRLRWREVTTSIEYFSTNEQVDYGAREITRLGVGEGILYRAGAVPLRVQFPLAKGPLDRTPKFAAKQVQALRREITARPMFAKPEQIIAERRDFERRLVGHLNRLAIERERPGLPSPADVPEDGPDDNPTLAI
jgi:hypothetical protein